jgi:hypothetical protein
MNKKGLTVVELLVTVFLFAFLLVAVAPGLQSFFARLEIHNGLRTVSAALSTARYTAIQENCLVRAEVARGCLRLSMDDGHGWRAFRSFSLGGKLSVGANGRPVFSPLGFVSPLCTITLALGKKTCRVVLSMYGRIRVYDNG